MADEKLTAATRIEKLLDNIAGGDNEVTPASRLEKFLSYIADAMEGGGGSGGGAQLRKVGNFGAAVTGKQNITTSASFSFNETDFSEVDYTGELFDLDGPISWAELEPYFASPDYIIVPVGTSVPVLDGTGYRIPSYNLTYIPEVSIPYVSCDGVLLTTNFVQPISAAVFFDIYQLEASDAGGQS